MKRLRAHIDDVGKGLVALTGMLLSACSAPPYPHGEFHEIYPQPPRPTLAEREVVVGDRRYKLQVAEMRGAADLSSDATPIVFVHGSPGDWKAWARYLDDPALRAYGPLIAVDRPGFGGSRELGVMTDLRAQAEVLAQLIPQGRRAIVVGHSLGGPLVAWMAIDHPERVCGAVMVAGAVAASVEQPRWYNRFAHGWLGRHLLPEVILQSNRELMVLDAELRRLDAAWPQLQRPLIAIQGEDDALVLPETADYLQQRVSPDWLRLQRVPDQGHFVVWERQDLVTTAIRGLACASQE